MRNILAAARRPARRPDWRSGCEHPEGVLYAEELVRLIRQSGDFCVGVAAFPYKHPRSPAIESDTEHFVRKCRAGADYAITQMFFRAEDYLRLRDRVAARGLRHADHPGHHAGHPASTIARSEQLSGAPFPPELAERFEAVADDPAAVRSLGIDQAAELCRRLLDEGAPGIHFITFNRSSATREVFQALDSAAGRPVAA